MRVGNLLFHAFRLSDGTDFVLITDARTRFGICEVVLGKYAFKRGD